MNISTFISLRYLLHREKDSTIKFMIRMCFAGIFIGTFSLMLTLIIMNGFEKVIGEKMRNINAEIIVYSPGNKLDFGGISNALKKEFDPYLKGVSCNSFKQAILDDGKTQSVIFLKGINPTTEPSVTNVADRIVRPLPKEPDRTGLLQQLLQPDHILVGHKTAREHGLSVGQTLTLLIPEPGGKKKINLKKT